MNQTDLTKHLLADHVDDPNANTRKNTSSQSLHRPPSGTRLSIITIGALLLSFLGNIVLLHKNHRLKQIQDLGRSRFSGLGYDYPVEYQSYSDYSSENTTTSDKLWEAIDTSPIVVALSDDYALEHDLQLSVRFPWDDEKGIYHIKAFHHLHCLKNMRKAYLDLQQGSEAVVSAAHVYHCLDILRQDLMCLADDTPMPTINAIHQIGNRQVRQCRDWRKLVAWTQEPDRHACYHMLDDYKKVHHTLEEFAYCDKNSQYLPVAEKYFAKFGHKDPYED